MAEVTEEAVVEQLHLQRIYFLTFLLPLALYLFHYQLPAMEGVEDSAG